MKTKLSILALFAFSAFGQTTYTLELGAGGYLNTTPHSAGTLNVLVGGSTSSVLSYSSFEMRPIASRTPSLTSTTGIQWTLASTGKVEFAAIAAGGLATSSATTSFAGVTGGKVSFHPGFKSAQGLYFFATGQASGTSQALGGWNPQLTIGVGFQFSGTGSGTLSARKKAK